MARIILILLAALLPLYAQPHVVVSVDFPAVAVCVPGTNGLTTICTNSARRYSAVQESQRSG